ncbi:lipopolysaccharide biosynthesis protein [Rivibacter subsaxonicus]|uniref:O-antigen/teichoic acid export membrane protein n=1 Tax=Rivibacter subsaxonicus TaxID=457575 RepID=A0A4V2FRS4_9BURK|nr:polysaccharide biosynthesis C-terminal domain-containing protein [Rivibacter subsaxonicus]RZT91439.1 O-antigen/teichoic acid export membrane protein [Rivibacter subsaxonicus]
MQIARRAATLALIAAGGQVIAYLLQVLLARRLGVDGFEAYVAAASAFILMVTLAPRGIEKYALRVLPAMLERGDWGAARGYLRFALAQVLLASVLTALLVAIWALGFSDGSNARRWAIVFSCLALPAGALTHCALEILSAAGGELRAAAIFRVAVPGLVLAMVALLLPLFPEPSGVVAIAAWGVAWSLALVLMALALRRIAPPQIWRAVPRAAPRLWIREARPFWIYRISMAVLAQAPIVALVALQPSPAAVGAYAAAAGTVSLVVVLVTATNRIYARRLAVLLERGDYDGVLEQRRLRLRWLAPLMVLMLLVAFLFSEPLLAFVRPEFVADGVAPLRLLSVAAAFSLLFAMAPTYLKYRRRKLATYSIVAGAAALQLVLLLLLVPNHGAAGAAWAYLLSMGSLYGVFAWLARREVLELQAAAPRGD